LPIPWALALADAWATAPTAALVPELLGALLAVLFVPEPPPIAARTSIDTTTAAPIPT
jgi:hypothetical protein